VRKSWLVLAALVALVALVGCQPEAGGLATGSPAPSASPTPSSRATASPPPSPSPTPSPAPSAADGTNVAACEDVRCEVLVRAGTAIPVPKSTDVGNLKVSKVTADRVTFAGRVLGNRSGGGCYGRGSCDVSSSNGVFTMSLTGGAIASQNGLAVEVKAFVDGAAIIAIEPVS
jgi:hypothetical protein